jgi:hypothetical protein
MKSIIPAKGTKGCLIHTGNNNYVFRVYDNGHNFIDYDLLHSDLFVTIDDDDATFYRNEFGDTLDHAPATLGKEQ